MPGNVRVSLLFGYNHAWHAMNSSLPEILLASIISGLLGVVVTIVYSRFNERRQQKLVVLEKFCANRNHLRGDKFTEAINGIFIAFKNSREVREKLLAFHKTITKNITDDTKTANNDLIELFKAMCRDLGINPHEYSEYFFLTPFNVKT